MAERRRYHSGRIDELKPNQVFVFGSNLAGVHGAGAARAAELKFDAERGVGEGPTGDCYALPTKDTRIQTRALSQIAVSAELFCAWAGAHPEKEFLLTAVGCGLAGYKPAQIAPLFEHCPPNVIFPPEFRL
jgi:hypothetical protein